MFDAPTNAFLCVAAAASATACILGSLKQRPPIVYVFKPFTMLLILALAIQAGEDTEPAYRVLVVTGLLLSLAGDVFLMLPRDRFTAGLASFLAAHLVYVAAFATAGPLLTLIPWLCVALPFYAFLYPVLGRMRTPVAVYVAAIVAMAWQATNRWLAQDEFSALLALVGAGLFVFSDAALAWNRFRRPFPGAQAVVLSTYFAGQCGIALSVGAGEGLAGWLVR
ncbi:MAG: lysoplasmalogenase [Myxococcota bacterium]|nr:lysoplasmalogenase [Myxococcota bacterium]